LAARREHPDLFLAGSYESLAVRGAASAHVIAFARRHGSTCALIIAPRLLGSLMRDTGRLPHGAETWSDTAVRLPAGCARDWRCVVSSETVLAKSDEIAVGDAFRMFPAALLLEASRPG
jgi:(1->4)-alpha-D-glucan 1-alpha-D-glucosylmutase